MKALITGSSGFVGMHLSSELSAHGYAISGIDLAEDECTARVDIIDGQALMGHIQEIQPDVVFHLAAQASVPFSWREPKKTFEINVIGVINLLEAVRAGKKACRIVIIGSSDEYGIVKSHSPVSENTVLQPQNPYAASKKAQEDIISIYARAYDMDICLTRSFNHSGPGQKLGFLISDICWGIVQVEKGRSQCLKIGNMESVRDFTDVRDIVTAYRLLCEKGVSGEIYNVGSGIGYKVQDILNILLTMAKRDIPIIQDNERMRISDTPFLICDNTKLKMRTGWSLSIPIEETLRDTLEYYRHKE
jgi:GDP-4-dehydro-6-deoxy-D-mannose reductase